MDIFIIIAAFSGILIGLFAVFMLIEKFWNNRRRKAIIDHTAQMGFTELSSADININESYSPFLLLKHANLINDFAIHRRIDSEKQQHVLDIELSGSKGQNEKMTICLIKNPGLNLPKFMIKGQDKVRFTTRFIHDINRSVQSLFYRYHKIPVEFSKDFEESYQLLAPEDSQSLRKIFTQELIHLLEIHQGWQVEGMGDWLLFYRRGVMVKPSLLRDFVTECLTLAKGFFKSAG